MIHSLPDDDDEAFLHVNCETQALFTLVTQVDLHVLETRWKRPRKKQKEFQRRKERKWVDADWMQGTSTDSLLRPAGGISETVFFTTTDRHTTAPLTARILTLLRESYDDIIHVYSFITLCEFLDVNCRFSSTFSI